MLRADRLSVAVGIHGAATVFSRGLGLARSIALAWLMEASEYGLLGLALLLSNVLLPLLGLGIYEGITRYTPAAEAAGKLRAFLRMAVAIVGVMGLISAAVAVIAAKPLGALLFGQDGADRSGLLLATVFCVLSLVVFHSVVGFLKGLRLFRATGAVEAISSVVFTAGAVAIALAGAGTAPRMMMIYAAGNLVAVAFIARRLSSYLPATTETDEGAAPQSGRLLRFSIWAGGTALLWHVMSYVPTRSLLSSSGEEAVGALTAIRTVSQVVQILAAVLAGVVASHVTRRWELEGRAVASAYLDMLTRFSLLAVMLFSAVLIVSRPVVMLAFPSTFGVAGEAYPALVLFYVWFGASLLLAIRLTLLEKTGLLFACLAVGACVAAFASATWVRSTEPLEAAIRSTALASAAGAAVVVVLLGVAAAARGMRVSMGIWLILVASLALDQHWSVVVLACVVLSVIAWSTDLIIRRGERAEIAGLAAQSLHRLGAGRRP